MHGIYQEQQAFVLLRVEDCLGCILLGIHVFYCAGLHIVGHSCFLLWVVY